MISSPTAHGRATGQGTLPWKTDQWGFRTGTCAPGEAEKKREAIFVIGNSFAEALGSSYADSFVSVMACDAAKQNKAVGTSASRPTARPSITTRSGRRPNGWA